MRKYEKKIICFSVLAAALFWMIDVLYDYFYINYDESFAYVLFYDLKTHGFLIRPLVIGVFIILGCVIARYVTKSKGMEERYQELFNNINDCTFVFPFSDNRWQANFTEVNASACTRWGYDKKELLQLSLGSLVQDEDCSEISPLWERLKDDYHIFFETGLVTKSGDKVPVEVSAHIVRLGEQPHVLAIVRDITARKRGEEEILRLASFPQFSPTPILEVNAAGKINYCNIAAQETLKRLGIDELEAFLPDDLPQVLKMAREGGVSQFYREKSLKGALFGEFIHFVPQYSVLRIFPVNITVRRRAENALRESEQQLRTLTAQLLSIQETERRRISSELHDELGQGLTYLKLQLGAIKAKMRKDQNQLKKDCQSLLNYLDGIIENVRRLSWDLSPTVLEEMGLSSAMKYWLEEFSKYYNVKNLAVNIEEIDNLLNTYSFGRVIREGVNVALVGIPNVGKSSLLNYILKESRAIVSHIPGTTRDIIREEVSIDGILFRLYDTAGIRFSEDEIEKEGVMRSREAVENADIVLFINDIEQGFSNELYSELLTLTKSEKILIIFNKVDLINFQTNENINSFSKLITNNQENSSKPLNLIPDVFISAKSGYGINNLFSKLKEKVIGNSNYTEKTAIVSNLRHFNSLKSAKEYLINAKNSATAKLSGEFIAVDLRNAINSLGEIIGEVTSDDILNNIFSKFCIGK